MRDIEQFKITRSLCVKFLTSVTPEQCFEIPDGFNNNIAWNLGHLAVTQQLLNYKLSGLPLYIDSELVDLFGKGSSPKNWSENPNMNDIEKLLQELPEKLEEDYRGGRFESFTPYTTSAGVELNTIEEAIKFNNFHEGLHLGYMMALKRSLSR